MLDDLLEWITEQIEYYGLGRVVSGAITLLAAAGAISAALGTVVIIGATTAAIGFLTLVLLTAMVRDHARMRRTAANAHALLQRYCDILERTSPVTLDVTEWEQLVELDKKGGAYIVRKLTLTPQGGDLHFLRLRLTYYGSADQSDRIRRRVKASAKEVSGARWESSWFWKDVRTHEFLVHFRNPVAQGDSISVEAEWEWPMFSADLMAGGYEDFDIRFAHRVRKATHTVVLPLKNNEALPSVSHNSTVPRVEREGSRCRVTFVVDSCVQSVRYGVRIDRRRTGSA
jgi:hypothetical protein